MHAMRRNFTVDGASSLFRQREYYEQFSRYDFPPTLGDLIHFAASGELGGEREGGGRETAIPKWF